MEKKLIEINAGPCPACGRARVVHMDAMADGKCEALVICPACQTMNKYSADSMELFVLRLHAEPTPDGAKGKTDSDDGFAGESGQAAEA